MRPTRVARTGRRRSKGARALGMSPFRAIRRNARACRPLLTRSAKPSARKLEPIGTPPSLVALPSAAGDEPGYMRSTRSASLVGADVRRARKQRGHFVFPPAWDARRPRFYASAFPRSNSSPLLRARASAHLPLVMEASYRLSQRLSQVMVDSNERTTNCGAPKARPVVFSHYTLS